MGSPAHAIGPAADEVPQRGVSIDYWFAVGTYPVTFEPPGLRLNYLGFRLARRIE